MVGWCCYNYYTHVKVSKNEVSFGRKLFFFFCCILLEVAICVFELLNFENFYFYCLSRIVSSLFVDKYYLILFDVLLYWGLLCAGILSKYVLNFRCTVKLFEEEKRLKMQVRQIHILGFEEPSYSRCC